MSRATTPTEPDFVLIAPDREGARRIYVTSERVLDVFRARLLRKLDRATLFELFTELPTLPTEDVETAARLLCAEGLLSHAPRRPRLFELTKKGAALLAGRLPLTSTPTSEAAAPPEETRC